MKTIVALCTALLIASETFAQTEVTVGVMRGKDYGVTYMLPKTELEIEIHTTHHTYVPGEFCKYAERYLHLTDASPRQNSYWTIDKVAMRSVGVPDKEKVYFVKMKDKSIAPLMELTEDGIVRSINMPFSGTPKQQTEKSGDMAEVQAAPDPRSFLTEEILMANSVAKRAELVAKEIYSIRESRNALLRGEADNMPQDGEQLKLMLDNLAIQEQAMVSMFAGQTKKELNTTILRIPIHETEGEIAFRFSRYFGVVDSTNLAGEPYRLTIQNMEEPSMEQPTAEIEKRKSLDGVMYNNPGRARVILRFRNQTLYDQELPATQFGGQECLAAVLFNKGFNTKVLFDVNTGKVLKVDRGE